jgi:hypothetical protein
VGLGQPEAVKRSSTSHNVGWVNRKPSSMLDFSIHDY